MKNVADFKAKVLEKVSKDEAEKAIKVVLKYIGENPNREGLVETPKRVIKAFNEYLVVIVKILKNTYLKLLEMLKDMMIWLFRKTSQFKVIVSTIWLQY